MTHPHSFKKLVGPLGVIAGLGVAALLVSHVWSGADRSADVRSLQVECGNTDDPPGTGMPAWPDGKQRYYTRQHWTEAGELKVEVWEFLSPGYVLVSADREVKGRRIVIKPRWEVPPDGAVAACHAKLGVEVTFRNLPRGDYVIDAR
ncbi:hypothetical protein [Roseateles sp. LYH14W]|uniref:Secreted protein n=1 Tax=Pelomonas parva TaxID=3299032 RepID=A0ABW7F9C0_9BURK